MSHDVGRLNLKKMRPCRMTAEFWHQISSAGSTSGTGEKFKIFIGWAAALNFTHSGLIWSLAVAKRGFRCRMRYNVNWRGKLFALGPDSKTDLNCSVCICQNVFFCSPRSYDVVMMSWWWWWYWYQGSVEFLSYIYLLPTHHCLMPPMTQSVEVVLTLTTTTGQSE